MEFFVPDPGGDGKLPPKEGETAWLACWQAARTDMGREPLTRRVYRLDYEQNGRPLQAVVGDLEQDEEFGVVMAIIAFPGAFGSTEADCYSIRCSRRGYLAAGDPIIVGCEAVRAAEDFE